MSRNSLRLLGIVALAAAIGLPVSASAQSKGKGDSGGGSEWAAFQGLGPDGETAVKGNDKESVAVKPGDYSDEPPTWEKIFPPEDFPDGPKTQLESGRTPAEITGNETEVGTLVIDTDVELDMKGTSLFVGVIVIRNCGSLVMKGNPNVYGAIIVDATRPAAGGGREECPQPYDPFNGNGTPAVRFVGDLGGGGSGVGTDKRGITIWHERFQ